MHALVGAQPLRLGGDQGRLITRALRCALALGALERWDEQRESDADDDRAGKSPQRELATRDRRHLDVLCSDWPQRRHQLLLPRPCL